MVIPYIFIWYHVEIPETKSPEDRIPERRNSRRQNPHTTKSPYEISPKLNAVRGFWPLCTRDQFYELQIILITFLGYWLGGGYGGAAPPPTDSRDQFHNLRKKLSDGKKHPAFYRSEILSYGSINEK